MTISSFQPVSISVRTAVGSFEGLKLATPHVDFLKVPVRTAVGSFEGLKQEPTLKLLLLAVRQNGRWFL